MRLKNNNKINKSAAMVEDDAETLSDSYVNMTSFIYTFTDAWYLK